MSDEKKPNVFPSKQEMEEANKQISADATSKLEAYTAAPDSTEAEKLAAKEMYEKTQAQIKVREEQMQKAIEDAERGQAHNDDIMARAAEEKAVRDAMFAPQAPAQTPTPPAPPVFNPPTIDEGSNALPEGFVKEIMEPQWDAPYDMIPLPSEGKLNKGVKPNIRVAFLNASDENLLTSPHILESDQFLEILMNRKILEPNLRYKDLHVGDRNAIMIWLRATAYGVEYPITILDEVGKVFEYEYNLSDLKTKNLKVDPDVDGLFNFTLPTNGNVVRFKLLNTGEVDELDTSLTYDRDVLNSPVNSTITSTLEKQIVDINGETDSEKLKVAISYMRTIDRKKLMEYIEDIQSGLDLNITVPTPSGGSVTTLLPLNFSFFWPNN